MRCPRRPRHAAEDLHRRRLAGPFLREPNSIPAARRDHAAQRLDVRIPLAESTVSITIAQTPRPPVPPPAVISARTAADFLAVMARAWSRSCGGDTARPARRSRPCPPGPCRDERARAGRSSSTPRVRAAVRFATGSGDDQLLASGGCPAARAGRTRRFSTAGFHLSSVAVDRHPTRGGRRATPLLLF